MNHLFRVRIISAFTMPAVFFVGIDEAGHGTHVALRMMGGYAALAAVIIFHEVWRSYRDDPDDGPPPESS